MSAPPSPPPPAVPVPVPSRREELRALARLAVPIAFVQMGQALMGFTDTAVMGLAGAEPLAAVSLGNGLFFAASALGMGIMFGLDPLMSQAFGARAPARARGLLWQGAWLALACGLVLSLVLTVAPEVLRVVRVEGAQLQRVREYVWWRAPSLPLFLLLLSTRTYLQAAARTSALVWATVGANVFNLVADVLLVFGGRGVPEAFGGDAVEAWLGPLQALPAMGGKGAALATTLGSLLQWGWVAWSVRAVPVGGELPPRAPRAEDLRRAFGVGLPVGLHIFAEVLVFVAAGVASAWFGTSATGAHQIALQYGSLTFTVAMGIGAAGSVRVGWAVGAQRAPHARRSGFVALGTGAAFMSLCGVVFTLFPEPLARLANAPPDVLPQVLPLLQICALFQVADGLQGVGAGVLRGAGDTRFTFAANMVGHYLVGVPVAGVVGFLWGRGVVGIWWGLCVGLVAVSIALVWRFHRVSARELKPLEDAKAEVEEALAEG